MPEKWIAIKTRIENMIKTEGVLVKKDPELPGQPKRPIPDLKPGRRFTHGVINAEAYKPCHVNKEVSEHLSTGPDEM